MCIFAILVQMELIERGVIFIYLLIFYLPRSITTYITKQYEIITLIVIRRIFKDLSNLELSSDWFVIKNDLDFTYDIVTAILLFFMIYLFSFLKDSIDGSNLKDSLDLPQIRQFIKIKKLMATTLIPVFVLIGIFTFSGWTIFGKQIQKMHTT